VIQSNLTGIYCGGSAPIIKVCEVLGNDNMGIHVDASTAAPTIEDCWVHDNGQYGINIANNSGEVVVRDCNIEDNADYGLSVYPCDDVNIIDCTISGNGDHGIRASIKDGTIDGCVIKNNAGDGIYIAQGGGDTSAILRNRIENNSGCGIKAIGFNYSTCDIMYNKIIGGANDGISLDSSGGGSGNVYSNLIRDTGGCGIAATDSASWDLWNNTIVGCAEIGIFVLSGSQPDISNCIIWNCTQDMNNCTATYSCLSDCNDAAGTGNICGDGNDPNFVDPGNDNYHLVADSPCVDAGDPCGDYSGQRDIDYEPRVADVDCDSNGVVDMGADEVYWPQDWGCATQCYGDADCDDDVDLADLFILKAASGTEYGDPNYNASADFDKDGDINLGELFILKANFSPPDPNADCSCGGTWPPE
jgi:hypothetical protein